LCSFPFWYRPIHFKLLAEFRDRLLHNFPLQGSLFDERSQNLSILGSYSQTRAKDSGFILNVGVKTLA
jgi:hypothetical protein